MFNDVYLWRFVKPASQHKKNLSSCRMEKRFVKPWYPGFEIKIVGVLFVNSQ